MITKSKFNVGDTAYITLEAIKAKLIMKGKLLSPFIVNIETEYFKLETPYKITNIVDYYDENNNKIFDILVEGSNNFVNQDYFSKDKQYREPMSLLNRYGLYLKQLADEDIKQALQQEPSIESICETKAELFTNETLKSVDSLLSDDYRIGFKEGIEKYLIKNYNTNDVIK